MTRLNLVRKAAAPVPPYNCELTCFDVNMVPFYLGALWLRAQKYWWLTSDDQRIARSALNEEMVRLLMPCGEDIVEAVNRVYMLLDKALFAQEYDYTGEGTPEDPYVLTNEVPPAPGSLRGGSGEGMFESAHATRDWVEGMAAGYSNDYNGDTRNVRQQLEDIFNRIGEGGFDDTEILAQMAAILVKLG